MLAHQLKSADACLRECEKRGPTLSGGVAAAKFISTIINGMRGNGIAVANAFVRSDVLPVCQYLTSEVRFGPNGIHQNFGLPKVSEKEIRSIEQSIPIINKMVNTATHFVHTGKIK